MPKIPEERRKDYRELTDLITQLATVIANLNNLLENFSRHVALDELMHKDMSDRIISLERNESNIQGKMWGIGVLCATVAAFFIEYVDKILK